MPLFLSRRASPPPAADEWQCRTLKLAVNYGLDRFAHRPAAPAAGCAPIILDAVRQAPGQCCCATPSPLNRKPPHARGPRMACVCLSRIKHVRPRRRHCLAAAPPSACL